jgi:hypothetical protein
MYLTSIYEWHLCIYQGLWFFLNNMKIHSSPTLKKRSFGPIYGYPFDDNAPVIRI